MSNPPIPAPAPGVSEATTLHGPEDGGSGAGERVLRIVGPDRFETHPLPASGRLTLGRSTDADVCIMHASVSRRHAVLHVGPAIELEDLGSANGTSVGSRALASGERATLTVGAIATLGTITLVIQRVAARAAVVADGEGMRPLHALVDRVAPSTLSVLLVGETGVGKDVFANSIHARSPRSAAPFLTLNCAAFSEALLESELFGYERGAFTGAAGSKPGLLESAEGGTVFLDEIGELPLNLQPKLLRVIEDRQVRRRGALKARAVDVRFVAATNRDLERAIEEGTFRRDLYFRLAGVTLTIPPLRERVAEIAPLARTFAVQAASASGQAAPAFSAEATRAGGLCLAGQHPGAPERRRARRALCHGEHDRAGALAARHDARLDGGRSRGGPSGDDAPHRAPSIRGGPRAAAAGPPRGGEAARHRRVARVRGQPEPGGEAPGHLAQHPAGAARRARAAAPSQEVTAPMLPSPRGPRRVPRRSNRR